MAKSAIYTVGGTVQAGGGIYIKRKADDELLELCRQGEFAFILSSRQVGKSSLMVRTAQQLEKENIRSVTIDLSAIGVKISQDEWYLGILNEVATTLNLETDIFAWWVQYAQLGPSQRLTNFFKDVLMKEVNEQIVLFFDEIDSTLSIPFSDDFYIALRAVYNARSINPDFKRLSFVLVGVAAPSDLISDNKRTPFNIGRRVEINDFTLAEALPLAEGLGEQAVQVLTWVFQYTGGHPYLTQRLCAYLANSKETLDEQAIAIAVDRLFTGEQGKQDNNLQFVRDMLSARSPDVTMVLKTYKDIRSGKKVIDDERSITKAHLKLSGLVRSEKGILRVRNEIYNTVFNPQWIQENTPKNWQKIALISLSAALGILILVTLTVFINDYLIGTKIDHHVKDFYFAKSPRQRLADLAEIYKRKGILSNKDSALTASQLFYGGLSSAEDQLALFNAYEIDRDPGLQNDMVFVISHLYITVANVDPEEDNTELLQAMLNAVTSISDNPTATSLKDEITAWIAGRKSFSSGDFEGALTNYNNALSLNLGNQALLYERAKIYIKLEQYASALSDLEAAISAAKQSAPDIATPTPTASSVPVTATLNPTAVQTKETGFPQTSLPTQINKTPTEVITPTLELTPTPTIGATATSTNSSPKKYESNFTTLIDVVNAVRSLIGNTPQLQSAMQSNGQREYTNLQSFGLIPIALSTAASNISSQNLPASVVVFSPDGKTLAWGSADNTVALWDMSNLNRPVQLFILKGHSDAVVSVAFSPDGKTLASGSLDKSIILWDVATGQPIGQPLMGHTASVNSLAFSPDGKILASGSSDTTTMLWDVITHQPIGQPYTGVGAISSIAFSPDGKYLVSGGGDQTAHVWEAASGKEIAHLTHNGWVSSVEFSPDGKYVVSGSDDHIARVWEAASGKEIARMSHDDRVNSVAFSPDGKYVASGSADKTARVWEAFTGLEIASLTLAPIGTFPDFFQADYVNTVHPCPGTWWVRVNLTNKFNNTLKSMSISVKDTVTGNVALSTESPNVFTDQDPSVCHPGVDFGDPTGIPNLAPNLSFIVSSGVLQKDPTGDSLEVTLKLCTEEGLSGQCSEKTISFTPGTTISPTISVSPAIGADWPINCISVFWKPFPDSIQVQQNDGCLVQPVDTFFTSGGHLSLAFTGRISGAQIHGLFAQLPSDGTASLNVHLTEVVGGEVLIGIFSEPDVSSNGLFLVIPAGKALDEQRMLIRTMPDKNIFSQTAGPVISSSATYDVSFDFNGGNVSIKLTNNQINLGSVPIDSTEKWLFIGYQALNGTNSLQADFFDLAVQSR